jgi:hypothetical protein
MLVRLRWWIKRVMVAVLTVLGAAGCGRDQNTVPLTWEASGTQVTRLELPLAGDVHSFVVGEYVLQGQESSGQNVRYFRDRTLLTADVLRDHGQVSGYVNRMYAGGDTLALRIYGRIEPVAGDPKEALVTGRVFPVAFDGGVSTRLMAIHRFEMRLDRGRGKISARGF